MVVFFMKDLMFLLPFSILAIIFNVKVLYLAKQDNYSATIYRFSDKFSTNVLMAILILISIALFFIPKDFSYPGTALLILWFGTVPHRVYICYKNYLLTENFKDLFIMILTGVFVILIYWNFLFMLFM